MSSQQVRRYRFPPTPPTRRRAEAAAIYHLLRAIAADQKKATESFAVDGTEVSPEVVRQKMLDAKWHHVLRRFPK